MKIIHCADLHLDSRMESNLDREQALLRREELLETYERMVSYANHHQVRVIIIAGDLFDKTHIRKTAARRVLDQMYQNPRIDFCYLRGNHDRCDFLSDLAQEEVPENLKLFSSEEWISYTYGNVVITGLELTSQNAGSLGMDLVLDQTKCNIVTLHGQESDYAGQSQDRAQIIPLSSLRGKHIDYLALGHIHGYREGRLDDRGVYCYSGCLEGRGFDECGSKGFVLLDVQDGEISRQFIPFARRQCHHVTVELDGCTAMPEIMDRVSSAVENIHEEDLVKVVLTGKIPMDLDVDSGRVLRMLRERFFFAKCYDNTGVLIDYEAFAHDRTLKGEFVRLMGERDLSEEDRAQIIELGIRAIMGEEI